jgi:hypothetical protein
VIGWRRVGFSLNLTICLSFSLLNTEHSNKVWSSRPGLKVWSWGPPLTLCSCILLFLVKVLLFLRSLLFPLPFRGLLLKCLSPPEWGPLCHCFPYNIMCVCVCVVYVIYIIYYNVHVSKLTNTLTLIMYVYIVYNMTHNILIHK